VVILDALMVVEIVDHDAEGFLDRTGRGVTEPVDPLEPRAVAEVKTRYRVDAVSGRWPSRQVYRTKPHQGCAQRFALLWIVPPAVARELRQQRGIGVAFLCKLLREPAPEARHRRQRRKPLELRKVRLQLLDHLLDQEVAERDAVQAVLTVGDRIEDRGVRACRLRPRRVLLHILRQQRRYRRGQSLNQRDLDEDQRFAGKRGMEKGKAA